MRYISLPAIGIEVSLSSYVDAIKMAKKNPDKMFKHGLNSWWSTSGREIVNQFYRGLEDRINQGVSYHVRGNLKLVN